MIALLKRIDNFYGNGDDLIYESVFGTFPDDYSNSSPREQIEAVRYRISFSYRGETTTVHLAVVRDWEDPKRPKEQMEEFKKYFIYLPDSDILRIIMGRMLDPMTEN